MVKYQWTIFWVNLDPAIGSEQSGRRPAIVISDEIVNQSLPILTVLPLTSFKNRKVYPNEYFLSKDDSGLSKDSIVMAHQIRTISKERLLSKAGEVFNEITRDGIRDAVLFQLELTN